MTKYSQQIVSQKKSLSFLFIKSVKKLTKLNFPLTINAEIQRPKIKFPLESQKFHHVFSQLSFPRDLLRTTFSDKIIINNKYCNYDIIIFDIPI